MIPPELVEAKVHDVLSRPEFREPAPPAPSYWDRLLEPIKGGAGFCIPLPFDIVPAVREDPESHGPELRTRTDPKPEVPTQPPPVPPIKSAPSIFTPKPKATASPPVQRSQPKPQSEAAPIQSASPAPAPTRVKRMPPAKRPAGHDSGLSWWAHGLVWLFALSFLAAVYRRYLFSHASKLVAPQAQPRRLAPKGGNKSEVVIDPRQAVLDAHRLLLARLAARQSLRLEEWKTNGRYLRECPLGEPARPLLVELSDGFDRVVYGQCAADPEDALRWLQEAQRV